MTYAEKLRDPRWQKRRLEIMNRDGFQCRWCNDASSTLAVHHLLYRRGWEPWEYPDELLVCVCAECHERWHEFSALLNEAAACLEPWQLRQLAEFAQAFTRINHSHLSVESKYWINRALSTIEDV